MKKLPFSFALGLAFLLSLSIGNAQMISVPENLWRLVPQEDTDGNRQITVHDQVTPFALKDDGGATVQTVEGVYPLSVLLQELKRADEKHQPEIAVTELRLKESAVTRTHRLIKQFYWDALTRRIDGEHIDEVVSDPKTASKFDYIYVSGSDATAVRYFRQVEREAAARNRSPALKVEVLPSPDEITGEFVRRLDGRHGLLSLKLELDSQGNPIRGVPYVVPGGRFNEVYYWDSYFIVLGLLQDGRKDLARSMADNFLYAMEHYGKIPNANRTYYLTRSQPPFLTSIIRAVYDAGAADQTWLASALKTAMTEYETVWTGRERLVRVGAHQLSRYFGEGNGPCPEVEIGHYDEKLAPWIALANTTPGRPLMPLEFINQYLYCGQFADLKAEGLTLDKFFRHDRAVRESGHDTTHRFDDRTADFVSVDLNSLLYRYEMDFAELIDQEFSGQLPGMDADSSRAGYWRAKAAERKQSMLDLMWDEERGFFFDYDFVNQKRSTYISATGLYPLWAKLLDANDPKDVKRAQRMAAYAREKLEQNSGFSATARESVASAHRQDLRQWDYPFGWAPHQMLAWRGLKNFGLDSDAERLAYRWLYTIAKNAHDYNGTIPEKYNVVTGSHDVFVEYGNVGTKFSYIAPEGFGWMNASFQVGTNYLSSEKMTALGKLEPPEPK